MAAIGYVFLAIGKDDALPVAEQQRMIEQYGAQQDIAIDEFLIEKDTSLKKPVAQRTLGKGMLRRVVAGDHIICPRSEWIFASAREGVQLILSLRKRGVSLHCVDIGEDIVLEGERKLVVSEGSASLILKVLSALAACESSKHGERIRATKKVMKEAGRYTGGPVPFGWCVDGDGYLVQDPEQQKVINEIQRLRADRWSYRDVAHKIEAKMAVKLSHAGIRKILANDLKKKEAEKKRKRREQQAAPSEQ